MYYLPTVGAESWKHLLAEPEKQWRTGYSAKALAHCWEDARGFPKSVRQVLKSSPDKALQEPAFILGIAEHRTPLPPASGAPSQSDILVLAKSGADLITITVEGKVADPFGPWVSEWLQDASPGKEERLTFICEALQVRKEAVQSIHYQLLHRTVATLLEAERFSAKYALMLVHSFSQTHRWFNEYAQFAALLAGKTVQAETVVHVGKRMGKELYLAWVTGEEEYLNR